MKKKMLAMLLAAVMVMAMLPTAFAADTTAVTAAGISFNAMTTDRYQSQKNAFEDADLGEEAAFLYHIGLITYGEDDGLRSFWAYLVGDDVTLDFHVKEGDKFCIEGYSLSVGESDSYDGTVYVATFIDGASFTVQEDDFVVDKAFIEQEYPGADYLICYRGGYNPDIGYDEVIYIVFADEDAVPNTYDSTGPEAVEPTEPTEPTEPDTPDVTFTDVPADIWYAEAVTWFVKEGYVTGYTDGTYRPNIEMPEYQILTLMYRAAGSPPSDAPLPDGVADDLYYSDALRWAMELGLIDDTFQISTLCTRATSIYYLWKVYGSKSAEGGASFSDVPEDAYYADAVAWAVEEGIVNGYTNGTYRPDIIFNRAQIAQLLYNTLALEAE